MEAFNIASEAGLPVALTIVLTTVTSISVVLTRAGVFRSLWKLASSAIWARRLRRLGVRDKRIRKVVEAAARADLTK